METYRIEHLTFSYPGQQTPALNQIDLTVNQGEFITLCGPSGCGKTTLLRQLKTVLAPHGQKSGTIFFQGTPLEELDQRCQSETIGFVLQSPENQVVTDKVWHELAFGLESLGYDTPTIRLRVSEMASFFGIQTWFYKDVAALSGGQKQLLNLAAIMAMQPSVLILDEPTSQLDPIAASEFLATVGKINRELGTTVILTEHRLETAFPLSDRCIVLDEGKIIAAASPQAVGEILRQQGHKMFLAMPTPMRIWAGVKNDQACPITVREGRRWLDTFAQSHQLKPVTPRVAPQLPAVPPAIVLDQVWFRYEKELPDVVKGLSLTVPTGMFCAIVGGNGTGKTTTLSLIAGIHTPYRGEVRLAGRRLADLSDQEKFRGFLGVLPQNPQALFVKKTVELDLYEILTDQACSKAEKARRVAAVAALCGLEPLLQQHPYDLSGGEQQRAALAKVLLLEPKILLLDEPTKGLDSDFKEKLAHILKQLQAAGTTILMVSHDIEFCASYADWCAMCFDGTIVTQGEPGVFFSGNSFYTTAANRMVRHLLPTAVTVADVVTACGGKTAPPAVFAPGGGDQNPGCDTQKPGCGDQNPGCDTQKPGCDNQKPGCGDQNPGGGNQNPGCDTQKPGGDTKRKWHKPLAFGLLTVAIILTYLVIQYIPVELAMTGDLLTALPASGGVWRYGAALLVIVLCAEMALVLLSKNQTRRPVVPEVCQMPVGRRKLPKRTRVAAWLILLLIPLTIFIGVFYLDNRKYYFISLLVMIETILPFLLIFEQRKPRARELTVIAVLCALAVAGRAAFFMLPQFKPVAALVILAAVAFGGETGFVVGAVTMFLSNMFYGQGPLTPWQMFAMGLIGFLAGVLFKKGVLRRDRVALCVFGFFASFLLYGGIMNPAVVLMTQEAPTWPMFAAAYLTGIPFDLIHGTATAFFLWVIGPAMLEKLDRIKQKYGLIEP